MEAGRRALDFSIRAIDAYRKTLLIDKLTSDDERSPPVYLLNEISDILRSCSLDLTQEIVQYTFRRLRHHSPQVKCKVLRFIKYTVKRSGCAAYRKELQSYSASIRELFNFQGQVDPLKGNALNQAVRDAAHEAIKAIFSSDTNLPAPKNLNNRIEGFGNGSFSKSFVGSYRSAAIAETERGSLQHYDGNGYFDAATCKQDYKNEFQENVNYKVNRESVKVSSPEEKLLDKVTASTQGLCLQPTHECLKFFLSSAKTLDAVRVALALKAKLQSPSWQVRLKALCVLQALLYEKDGSLWQAIEVDGGGFHDCVKECLASPQTALRKKAKEVFNNLEALKKAKDHKGSPNMLLDELSQLDDGDASFLCPAPATTFHTHQVVDLLSFRNDDVAPVQTAETSTTISLMDDPFVGMCIYGSNESTEEHVEDLLSGGWTDNSVLLVEAPSGNVKKEQNDVVLRTVPQSNPIKQNLPALGNTFTTDIAAKSSTTTGKSATGKSALPSLDSHTFLADSKGNVPDLQNLNALYMFPMGVVGPSHNIAALQQCPGGSHGFGFGIHNATTTINGQTAAARHGLGDIYFQEFGLSN